MSKFFAGLTNKVKDVIAKAKGRNYVGQDKHGNKYYITIDSSKIEHRCVEYKDSSDFVAAMKSIPQEWDAWMRKKIDRIPTEEDAKRIEFYREEIRRKVERVEEEERRKEMLAQMGLLAEKANSDTQHIEQYMYISEQEKRSAAPSSPFSPSSFRDPTNQRAIRRALDAANIDTDEAYFRQVHDEHTENHSVQGVDVNALNRMISSKNAVAAESLRKQQEQKEKELQEKKEAQLEEHVRYLQPNEPMTHVEAEGGRQQTQTAQVSNMSAEETRQHVKKHSQSRTSRFLGVVPQPRDFQKIKEQEELRKKAIEKGELEQ